MEVMQYKMQPQVYSTAGLVTKALHIISFIKYYFNTEIIVIRNNRILTDSVVL